MGTVSIAATVQPKNDIVKFWQTVIGPDYDIVVSSSTVDNFLFHLLPLVSLVAEKNCKMWHDMIIFRML